MIKIADFGLAYLQVPERGYCVCACACACVCMYIYKIVSVLSSCRSAERGAGLSLTLSLSLSLFLSINQSINQSITIPIDMSLSFSHFLYRAARPCFGQERGTDGVCAPCSTAECVRMRVCVSVFLRLWASVGARVCVCECVCVYPCVCVCGRARLCVNDGKH